MRDALGMAHRIGDRHCASLRDAEQREAFDAGSVHDGFEVADERLERNVLRRRDPREPLPRAIVADQRVIARQLAIEVPPDRTLRNRTRDASSSFLRSSPVAARCPRGNRPAARRSRVIRRIEPPVGSHARAGRRGQSPHTPRVATPEVPAAPRCPSGRAQRRRSRGSIFLTVCRLWRGRRENAICDI